MKMKIVKGFMIKAQKTCAGDAFAATFFLCMGNHDKNENVEAKKISIVTNGNNFFIITLAGFSFMKQY